MYPQGQHNTPAETGFSWPPGSENEIRISFQLRKSMFPHPQNLACMMTSMPGVVIKRLP